MVNNQHDVLPSANKSPVLHKEQAESTVTTEQAEQAEESSTLGGGSRKRNAFAELMASKPKQRKFDGHAVDESDNAEERSSAQVKPKPKPAAGRSGLSAYITKPGSFPSGTIIRETDHTILIRDLFPKALIHLLLIPKDPTWYNLSPFEAFNSAGNKHEAFLDLMKAEAASAAEMAASELSRLVSPHSASCKARREALNSSDPPEELPIARDFLPDIKIGIHAKPSMDTLHIHIISVDMHSERLKHKKHYNSFNTPFFVGLDDFPLMEEDNLMDVSERESLIKGDMKCWKCDKNFGNKFKQLKDHLEEEYNAWKKI